MPKTVAYIRVSSKDQNLDRQIDEMKKLGIEDKYIYDDKASGKDMDRIGYQYMKRTLEKGDTLVIKSLDRLGRNQQQIKDEWQYFKDNEINVRVLDMPTLNIDYSNQEQSGMYRMVANIVFEVMSFMAQEEREKIRQRQREGIDAARKRGKQFGRPSITLKTFPNSTKDKLKDNYPRWKNGEITAVEFARRLDLKKSTFYKIIKEYEETL